MRFWMFFSSTDSHVVDTSLSAGFTLCQKPVDVVFPSYVALNEAIERTTCRLCGALASKIRLNTDRPAPPTAARTPPPNPR